MIVIIHERIIKFLIVTYGLHAPMLPVILLEIPLQF